jgi:O-antigen biosynthesis protein
MGGMQNARKAVGILREGGARALAQRAVRVLAARLDIGQLDEPLLDGDIADSTRLTLATPSERPPRGAPLDIGWVTAPPRAGSGGHTTLFRMVEAAEAAGHRCHLFLYDRYGGDLAAQAATIRSWWPQLDADVRDARAGISGMDAIVASGWETAHVVARRASTPSRYLYFIQDYEPFFYPRGSEYSLAEDTYRFGFRNIALGDMVGGLLHRETGVPADITEFGCDTAVYRPLDGARRTGVVLYARPDVPRRGYWLAKLALREFHTKHPDVDIHVYGSIVKDLGVPATQHGRLSAVELNALYNRCIAGLAMSFTNISLVAEEMLAAGTIPIVNDSPLSRADLANDNVAWASPTPAGIADALSRVVTRHDPDAVQRAASSVRPFAWTKAQGDVVRIIEDEVYGPVTAAVVE